MKLSFIITADLRLSVYLELRKCCTFMKMIGFNGTNLCSQLYDVWIWPLQNRLNSAFRKGLITKNADTMNKLHQNKEKCPFLVRTAKPSYSLMHVLAWNFINLLLFKQKPKMKHSKMSRLIYLVYLYTYKFILTIFVFKKIQPFRPRNYSNIV